MRRKYPPVELKCQTCGKLFTVNRKYIRRDVKYCSRRCSADRPVLFDTTRALELWHQGKSARQIAVMLGAITETVVRDWLKKLGIYEPRHARGKQVHNWKGGVRLTDARRAMLIQKAGKCSRCGYKKHPEILQVHHKDRNRRNNNVDNLEVLCPNCHALEHYLTGTGLYSRHRRDE